MSTERCVSAKLLGFPSAAAGNRGDAMSFEDPAQLEFRRRPEQRPRRMQPFSSQSIWLVVAIIAAIIFVLFVRAMLERSAWTAGHSPDVVSSEPSYVPSDAELNTQGWSQLPQPEVIQPREVIASREVQNRALVYRCVGERGAVSFQSQPCGDGQNTTRVVDATPEYERPRRATSYVSQAAQTQRYNYVSANNDARNQRRANCESARRRRDATLEQVGLARTYDLLQQLDAMVYEACKGL